MGFFDRVARVGSSSNAQVARRLCAEFGARDYCDRCHADGFASPLFAIMEDGEALCVECVEELLGRMRFDVEREYQAVS
jgi:predicted CXXCH cytochrome family protein